MDSGSGAPPLWTAYVNVRSEPQVTGPFHPPVSPQGPRQDGVWSLGLPLPMPVRTRIEVPCTPPAATAQCMGPLTITDAELNRLSRRQTFLPHCSPQKFREQMPEFIKQLDPDSYARVSSAPRWPDVQVGLIDHVGEPNMRLMILTKGNIILDLRPVKGSVKETVKTALDAYGRGAHNRGPTKNGVSPSGNTVTINRGTKFDRNLIDCEELRSGKAKFVNVVSALYENGTHIETLQLPDGYRVETHDCLHPDTRERLPMMFLLDRHGNLVTVRHQPADEDGLRQVFAQFVRSAGRSSARMNPGKHAYPPVSKFSYERKKWVDQEQSMDIVVRYQQGMLVRNVDKSTKRVLAMLPNQSEICILNSHLGNPADPGNAHELLAIVGRNGGLQVAKLHDASTLQQDILMLQGSRARTVQARAAKRLGAQAQVARTPVSRRTDMVDQLRHARTTLLGVNPGDARAIDRVLRSLSNEAGQALANSLRDDLALNLGHELVLPEVLARRVIDRLQVLGHEPTD